MKTKKCDSCGYEFTGKSYPIIDENFNKQRGLIQCESCFANLTPKYVTFYNPDDSSAGHFCVYFRGDYNHTLSGTITLKELLQRYSCPIFDISKVEKLIDLCPANMLERGAIIIIQS